MTRLFPPVVLSSIPKKTLDALTKALAGAAATKNDDQTGIGSDHAALEVDRLRLEQDVLTILYATATAHDGSETSMLWHEKPDAVPDHKALARAFKQMATAPNPLDPQACPPELRSDLNRQIRRRRSGWRRYREGRGSDKASLEAVDWDTLGAEEQEELREMARHLAAWHSSHVQAKRPRKNDIDTLLTEAVIIFTAHCGKDPRDHVFSHMMNSFFLWFAGALLEPFYHWSEVTPGALVHRWRRLRSTTDWPPEPDRRKKPAKNRKGALRA